MADLEIKIKTSADLAAAKATTDALHHVAGATKGTGDAAKKVIQPLDEHGKHVEKLGLKHAEVKKLVHELGHEFPLLGEAARLALHPQVTAALAVVSALVLLKHNYEEAQAALAGGDWHTIPGLLTSQDTAARAAASSLGSYADELRRIATEQQTVKEKTGATVASMKAQFAFAAALRAAQAALAREQIESGRASGAISPIDAEKRKAALEKQSIEDNAAAELKAANDELEIQRASAAKVKKEMNAASARIQANSSTAAQIDKTIANKDPNRPGVTGQLAAYKQRLGVNEAGQAVDKDGKPIIQKDDGKKTGKRTGELGKLDQLEKDLEFAKTVLSRNATTPAATQDAMKQSIAIAQETFDQQKKFTDNLFKKID